uniref:eRF1/Pelota-like N-terminal domain-containing protein n=1 Tax=Physcomitrium patens TaxID=3218 RepID=A0A7I4DHN3_PHYPA
MKLVRQDITKNGAGSVKLVPEEPEDMWHVYNLVAKGDRVSGVTVRKVMRETASGAGEAERVRLKLEVEVETVEYDKVASVLRVRGKNMLESEHVKLGAYHTMELDQQRPFVLAKAVWDAMAIDYLKQACDPAASADVAAVMMQEGLANICLVGASITTVKGRVETSIPRKHGPAVAGYDKALNKFFENVLQAVLRHVNFAVVRCLVVASPGFTKDQFFSYMMLEATRRDLRPIVENKAHDRLAIQTLLITDELFRSADITTRRKYVDLVESVKAGGGDVYVFSSMHISGEQLQQLTGIAAILRFPLPDLEDMEL